MKDNIRDLVIRLQKGDRKAYETIYKLYAERIYFFSVKYLESEIEAEEVAQNVFIKIWVKREELRDDLSLNSFLFMITKNAVIDILRKRKRVREANQQISRHQKQLMEAPDDIYEYRELSREVNELINSLPERRRLIYRLSREHGLSHKEIAAKMSISTKTVEVQIRLSLQQIRAFLKKRLPSISAGGLLFIHFFIKAFFQ